MATRVPEKYSRTVTDTITNSSWSYDLLTLDAQMLQSPARLTRTFHYLRRPIKSGSCHAGRVGPCFARVLIQGVHPKSKSVHPF